MNDLKHHHWVPDWEPRLRRQRVVALIATGAAIALQVTILWIVLIGPSAELIAGLITH